MQVLATFLSSVLIVTVVSGLAQQCSGEPTQTTAVAVSAEKLFRDQIAPTLIAKCLVCHGGEKTEGGYSVKTFEDLLKAGDSEVPAITHGNLANSELWRRLTTDDVGERMPAEAAPLSTSQLAVIRNWIEAGAPLASSDHKRPLIEIATAQQITAPEHYPHPIAVNALAIHTGRNEVLVAGYVEVTRWDISNGKLVGRLPVAGAHIAAIDLSADENLLAISSGAPGERGMVELIALEGSVPSRLPLLPTVDVAPDLAFSPDGKRLLVAGHDGSLQLVDVNSNPLAIRSTVALTPHADAILAVAWSASGAQFITASRDRTAKLFDATKNELAASYDRHERAVGGIGFAENRPLSMDETGRLRVMVGDDSDRILAELSGLPRYLQRFRTDGSQVLIPAASYLRRLGIVQEKVDDGLDEKGKPKQKSVTRIVELEALAAPSSQWIASVAIQGKFIAAGTQQGKVLIWDKASGELIHQFLAQP